MAELPEPTTSAEDIRQITESVLSRPEFAEARPSWWDRFVSDVIDAIARFVEVVGAGDRGSIIGAVVLLSVAVAAVVVTLRFTRTVRSDPSRRVAVEGDVGKSALQWRREAQEHADAGRWREAVRCRYREVLAHLAAAGLVEEVAGRTSGEYLAVVSDTAPTARDAFSDVTRRFEVAWYGRGVTTDADADAFAAAADRVLADAGVRRRVPATT